MPDLEFDSQLIQRYDLSGPRYTSYPTAVQFTEEFGIEDYRQQIQSSNTANRPLSLYFHLPFCDTICFYCACNKIVTKNRNRAQPYLNLLYKEMALQAALFNTARPVDQLHWGGGTPTFISHGQMRDLMRITRELFNLHEDDSGEYSIEIDPREANAETILLLRDLGFNRLSLGVQDINPKVQLAVNRIQSIEETNEVINTARSVGFHSISVDLIYGLPFQTKDSFSETLQTVIEMQPDRLSVFNYAHMPDMFKTQRQIRSEDLPDARTKLAILEMSIDMLTTSGYVYIGMDHFARPEDELTQAQADGHLYRNFQGYSTHAHCDLIGMGVTSIGKIHDSYSQNYRTLDDYEKSVANNSLPIFRGITLTTDDRLRRKIITELICNFKLDINAIEHEYSINFDQYFSDIAPALQSMQDDGLILSGKNMIVITNKGGLLVRNICMLFDAYIRNSSHRYSKVI